MGTKLSNKHKIFIKEYLVDFNTTRAAKAAGYSENSAHTTGHEILKNQKVRKQIKKEMDKRQRICEINADMVVKQLAKIAFAKIGDYVHWDGESMELGDSGFVNDEAVQEVVFTKNTKKVKLHDKVKALEALAKHLGMYDIESKSNTDNREVIEEEILQDIRKLSGKEKV